jgi:hypothetical protein
LLDVELAGSRVAWVPLYGDVGKTDCDISLKSATFGDPVARTLHQPGVGAWGACKAPDPYHLHGDGDLLVFADRGFTGPDPRLVRVGGGSERCQQSFDTPSICATLRRRASAVAPESVSNGLIAARQASVVAVLDERGALVREFRFTPADVSLARLDGARLVISRRDVIEVYDGVSGADELTHPRPAGYRLVDVDGGIAVLLRDNTVMLLDLRDGRSRTVALGSGPVFADLEPPGLYYSHRVGQGGRAVFLPRAELF